MAKDKGILISLILFLFINLAVLMQLKAEEREVITKKNNTCQSYSWKRDTSELSGGSEQHIFHTFTVVDEQPLLKIKSTSLLHNAMMLYEGEM